MGVSLTSSLLGQVNDLPDRDLIAVDAQNLVPFFQAQRSNNKLCKIFGICEIDQLITGRSWDGSFPVSDIYKDDERVQVGFDMRHAEIVQEQSVLELCPFQICLAESFETLLTEDVWTN